MRLLSPVREVYNQIVFQLMNVYDHQDLHHSFAEWRELQSPDGRPQDRGYSREGVEKEYAVHDTKMALVEARRAYPVVVGGDDRIAATDDAARLRDALGIAVPQGLPIAFTDPVPDPLGDLVARYARTHGPFAAATCGTCVMRAVFAFAAASMSVPE